jgi:hypothetical protein
LFKRSLERMLEQEFITNARNRRWAAIAVVVGGGGGGGGGTKK